MENQNLNELVESLFRDNKHDKYKITSLKVNTIFFVDKHPLEVSICVKGIDGEDIDSILKRAEMIKKWRNNREE